MTRTSFAAILGVLAAVVTLGLFGSGAFAAPQSSSASVYGTLPHIDEVVISPNGKKLALLQTIGDKRAVIFYDLEKGGQPTGVSVDLKARGLIWGSDTHALLLISGTKRSGRYHWEVWRWVSIDSSSGKTTFLFQGNTAYNGLTSPGSLMSILPNEPDDVLIAQLDMTGSGGMIDNISGAVSLFRVNLKTGVEKRSLRGDSDVQGWIVDKNGEAVVAVEYSELQQEKRIFVTRDGGKKFEKIAEFEEKKGDEPFLELYATSPDKRFAYATARSGTDKLSLYEFDLATGTLGAVLFQNDTYDLSDIIYDQNTADIIGVLYTDDLPRSEYFDRNLQGLQLGLRQALPGAEPMITSLSRDRSKAIITAIYTDRPNEFFLYDGATKAISPLGAAYEGLAGRSIAKKQKFDYQASDGLKIPGYLTMPAGRGATNLPLVVLPHGGPDSRDTQSFDWWAFYYASRGYAVYQPNFRGSTGYGQNFRDAGFGEWGKRMQSDITEGVEKLIADGVVDPSRICIVGASYGGYAALAGATLTPDLYACSISINGVSNLAVMLSKEEGYTEKFWTKRIGNLTKDAAAIAAVSPARQAESVKAPVLIIYSLDDTVVETSQSKGMERALKDAGKTVEVVTLKGDDHWFSRGETRTKMLEVTGEFLDRHIGAGAQ